MPHPYYPKSWLDRQEASALLKQAGLPSRVTKALCRKRGIEISEVTGEGYYLRKSSLERFISREVKDLQECGLIEDQEESQP